MPVRDEAGMFPGAPNRGTAFCEGQAVESAATLLDRLRPLALVQKIPDIVPATAGSAECQRDMSPRYTMHPLVRDIAAELLEAGSREECLTTYKAFVDFCLFQGEELQSLWDQGHMESMIQLLGREHLNMGGVARVLGKLSNKVGVERHCLNAFVQLADNLFQYGFEQQAGPLMREVVRLQMEALGTKGLATACTIRY